MFYRSKGLSSTHMKDHSFITIHCIFRGDISFELGTNIPPANLWGGVSNTNWSTKCSC